MKNIMTSMMIIGMMMLGTTSVSGKNNGEPHMNEGRPRQEVRDIRKDQPRERREVRQEPVRHQPQPQPEPRTVVVEHHESNVGSVIGGVIVGTIIGSLIK